MDALTLFGWLTMVAMLICYSLERRSHWFILAFAFTCALAALYGFLTGAWPFAAVEVAWVVIVLKRWFDVRKG